MSAETGFWPGGAQAAVAITVNFTGESVERRTMPDGPLWGRYSYGRYGAQVGVQRLLDVFAEYGVRATFFISAWDVENHPEAMASIAAAGHEVAGHGFLYEDFSKLDVDAQRAVLERSEEVFRRVFGAAPAGWRAPEGLMTRATRPLLAERGYLYDSSFCDDDVPYLVSDDSGRRLVELPVFASASDRYYYLLRRSPESVLRGWREDLEAIYGVGGLFNLTLHPRGDYGSGRGVRIRSVAALLHQLAETPRLWRATCGEIADWMLQERGDGTTYPA
jgi:peptidoglycan/xylan/chitin deacetylase (PgdA/CDA1 family)